MPDRVRVNIVACPECARPVVEASTRRIRRALFNADPVQGARFVLREDGTMRHTPRSEPAPLVGYQLHHCSQNPGEAEVWRRRAGRQ